MPHDPRDVLWNDGYLLHYDIRYEEMLIARLLSIWSRIDAVIKILVALTSSSSAVAGWALWHEPGYRTIWGVVAGTSAALAILSSALGVQTRLKEHSAVRQKFVSLRGEVELLRHDMALDPNFPVPKIDDIYKKLKKQYTEYLNGEQHDILVCDWLENSVQKKLNASLSP